MMVAQLYCPVCMTPLTENGNDAWKIQSNYDELNAAGQTKALLEGEGHLHYNAVILSLNCVNGHGPWDMEWCGTMYRGSKVDGKSILTRDGRGTQITEATANTKG